MSKIININRPIRSNMWDNDYDRKYAVTPGEVERALKAAKGDDIRLDINSPGGLIISGLEMYNRILSYKKEYPKAKITARILGMAASMATVVAMSADRVEVNTASVWMVHNAMLISIGDYRDFQKDADMLKGFSQMIATLYAEREKTDKDSRYYFNLMDEETWLFGKEIIDNGFADDVWSVTEKGEKQNVLKTAKAEYFNFQAELKKNTEVAENYDKLAAMLPSSCVKKQQTETVVKNITKIKKEEKVMAGDEKITQKQVDEAYDRGLADGKKGMQDLIGKVTKFFNGDYPESIKKLGIDVLEGKAGPDALTGAAAVWDAQKETKKSEAAKKENGVDIPVDQQLTPGTSGGTGYANTEADYQNELKRLKAQGGIE